MADGAEAAAGGEAHTVAAGEAAGTGVVEAAAGGVVLTAAEDSVGENCRTQENRYDSFENCSKSADVVESDQP